MTSALITILAIFVVGMLIPQLLARSALGSTFRLFVVPGVIVHELSHAIGCIITGAKIQRIRFFKREGGDTTHTTSPIPIIGQLIISMMPLAVGFAAVLFLSQKIMPTNYSISYGFSIKDFPSFAFQVFKLIQWHSITSWVYLYLILSIGSTMIPSIRDFINSLWAFVALGGVIYVVYRTPAWHVLADHYATVLIPYLTLGFFILLILASISLVIYLISMIFGISR